MGLVLRDALMRLCVKIGWSYAVFWRTVGFQEQRYLIWEDGYCGGKHGGMSGFEAMDLLIKEKGFCAYRGEERLAEHGRPTENRIHMLVHKKMATQVHIEGNGLIGTVALTGIHKWVLQGNLDKNYPASKDLVEMNQQLLAGIHTIAVIPVLPHGVLQLGSTQLIFEEVGFVNHVQHLFMQSGSMTQAHLCDVGATSFNHNLQLPDSIQPSVSQYADVSSNVSALPSRRCHERENQLFIGHDLRFITRPPVFTSSLNKASDHYQQMLHNNDITRKRMLPSYLLQSSCHVSPNVFPNNQVKTEFAGHAGSSASNSRILEKTLPHQPVDVNDSSSPENLKSLENQFKLYHETTHESSDNPEALVDGSKLHDLRTHDSRLSNSLKDCERDSSFGRSCSTNKAGNIGNSIKSNGVTECIISRMSSDSEVSQFLSPKDDLDNIIMLSSGFGYIHSTSIGKRSVIMSSQGEENHGNGICESLSMPMTELDVHGSDERLEHSSNIDDWWYDSSLARVNKHDPKGTHALANYENSADARSTEALPPCIKVTSDPHQQNFERTLFDLFDLDQVSNSNHSLMDDSFPSLNSTGVCVSSSSVPACTSLVDSLNGEISYSGRLFSESGSDQLLDAVVSQVKRSCKLIPDDKVSRNIASANTHNLSIHNNSPECDMLALSEQLPGYFVRQSSNTVKSQHAGGNSIKSECSIDISEGVCPLKDGKHKSQISKWAGKAGSINCDEMSVANCRVDEESKLNRKRFRTGESTRPRPKDRQMIQDRVKELREIVPNGAKMSIDALLEKTIKHMLFLQSVTKHADKLKENGKPKIISKDEGLLLKDNFDGGATWAFEVGSRSVICPIVVEDLSTPRNMLVEMLCEKNGFFLEIADSIRGLGLTILKGVMEARDNKVWARFAVEANRDVTRMEVFLYLVHLLEPTVGNTGLEGIHNCKKKLDNMLRQTSIPLTGAADCL